VSYIVLVSVKGAAGYEPTRGRPNVTDYTCTCYIDVASVLHLLSGMSTNCTAGPADKSPAASCHWITA